MISNRKIGDLHKMQENHHKNILEDSESKRKSETWFAKDTVDYWRHKRMRDVLLPLILFFPKSSWLTVGDGRYGTDANYLLEKGLHAHASDIQDDLLKIGKEKGFIGDFSKQNAELLSFQDNEFDFVYCKESYHHFPRPAVALYEMLRVAKIGVVLQEPKDNLFFETPLQGLFHYFKEFAKFILGRRNKKHAFEEAGNYVYTLSPRELQKYALGINCRFIAHRTQQDCYKKGVEFEKTNDNSKLFRKIKRNILFYEFLYKLGLVTSGIMTGIILKEIPNDELIKKLESNGYKTEILSVNPYIQE